MSIPDGVASRTPRLSRAERRRRTREQLLDAAAAVFARRGYAAASVDEIAEAAGFTKGAVYANFAAKQDLFLALMDRQHQRQEALLVGLAEPARPVGQAMGDLGRVAAPTDPEAWQWGLLTLEFLLYAVRDPALRGQLAERLRAMRGYLAAALGPRLARRPGAPGLAPHELASVAMALSTGLGVQATVEPAALPPDLYARTLERLLS
jgi:AcrR family transcriptional regulator